MAIKTYSKEYGETLKNVFAVKQHFLRTFGGTLQVKDGITNSDNFLELKVSETDVTVQEYSTDANTGFGTGTGKTSRFGARKEIKSINKQVPFESALAIHEGVDNVTVNDNAEQIIEERGGLHAEAWVEKLNGLLGKALSDNAGATENVQLTEDGVSALFNKVHKAFVDNKVSKDIAWVAYVKPEIYNIIVDHKLATTAKGSSVNIDKEEVKMFKSFVIEELPSALFQTTECIYFAADNVGVAGVGIEIYRLIDSEDFAGVAIQSLAKYGKYIPEKNKKAIVKAKIAG